MIYWDEETTAKSVRAQKNLENKFSIWPTVGLIALLENDVMTNYLTSISIASNLRFL